MGNGYKTDTKGAKVPLKKSLFAAVKKTEKKSLKKSPTNSYFMKKKPEEPDVKSLKYLKKPFHHRKNIGEKKRKLKTTAKKNAKNFKFPGLELGQASNFCCGVGLLLFYRACPRRGCLSTISAQAPGISILEPVGFWVHAHIAGRGSVAKSAGRRNRGPSFSLRAGEQPELLDF